MCFFPRLQRSCGFKAVFVLLALVFSFFSGTAYAKEIVFADLEWNSVKVHNRIAGFIIEHGFGYNAQYLPSDMFSVFDALTDGEADVLMECWVSNHQGVYDKSIESGAVSDIGTNFTDSWQGWMIPTYVIKGDKERNIEPMAPDLDSVDDLPRYWELFRDPKIRTRGVFIPATPDGSARKSTKRSWPRTDSTRRTISICLNRSRSRSCRWKAHTSEAGPGSATTGLRVGSWVNSI